MIETATMNVEFKEIRLKIKKKKEIEYLQGSNLLKIFKTWKNKVGATYIFIILISN